MPVRPPPEYFKDPAKMARIDPQLARKMWAKQRIDAMPDGPEKDKALARWKKSMETDLMVIMIVLVSMFGILLGLLGHAIYLIIFN